MTDASKLRILNQMAGPMTWELAVDLANQIGRIDMFTGHPDTLSKGNQGRVHLHPALAYQRGSHFRRFYCWGRYTLQSALWLRRCHPSAPVLIFSNPPIGIWMCWILNRVFGLRYAVMVHDIYPDTIERMGIVSKKNPIARIWRALNRRAYQRAQVVMTLGQQMAGFLSQQFDASKTRPGEILVVPPWADADKFVRATSGDNWFARKHDQTDKLTVMYSGNMGLGHDIESILKAAERLEKAASISFMLIGAGPKWETIETHLQERHPKNIQLLPWQDEKDLPFTLTTANLAIVSLEPELSGLAIPSKAFYFLAAGVPLIAICEPDTELAAVIERFHCGCVVSPNRPEELSENILKAHTDTALLESWQLGAKEARQQYSRSKNTQRFQSILDEFLLESPTSQTVAIQNQVAS